MLDVRDFSCFFGGLEDRRGQEVASKWGESGRRPLLDGLNFSVAVGERVAIVGANGVGKTTLLRCLDLLRSDWVGTITLDGVDIRKISRRQLARSVACVQQIPPTSFTATAWEFVAMGRYPYLRPFAPLSARDEETIDSALEKTDTVRFAHRELGTLSGGERQKILIAAALAQEPRLLLLDEPATFLDVRRQEETAELLDRIQKESKITILEATHDLNRIALANARVLALADGRIAYDGSAAGLMNRETLRAVFGIELALVHHPETGQSMILPSAKNR